MTPTASGGVRRFFGHRNSSRTRPVLLERRAALRRSGLVVIREGFQPSERNDGALGSCLKGNHVIELSDFPRDHVSGGGEEGEQRFGVLAVSALKRSDQVLVHGTARFRVHKALPGGLTQGFLLTTYYRRLGFPV